ncbi:MAG: hypothetical protein COB50_01870, partial [Thiotrichales bacterium]
KEARRRLKLGSLLPSYFIIVADNDKSKHNWVFLPGGPGLGSEYFLPYLNSITLPGAVWRLDYSGDGSNRINNYENFSIKKSELVTALSELQNVILVAHYFSGNFALTVPELDTVLDALVIMDGTPNNKWQSNLPERERLYDLNSRGKLKDAYNQNRTDETLREYTLANWQFFISNDYEQEAKKLLDDLPYNHVPFDWAYKDFYPHHHDCWIPQHLPTLILAGSDDVIMPLENFTKDKRFLRNNICLKEIKDASHFPWIEQPDAVTNALVSFHKGLK